MTTRKFHIAHCPSCRFYFYGFGGKYCDEGIKYIPQTRTLKDSTAIKCKYYQQNEENKDAIITNAQ